MRSVHIDASKEYDVLIGSGLLKKSSQYIKRIKENAKTAVIISDDTVYPLYAGLLKSELEKCSLHTEVFVFAHGEASKNLRTYSEILEFMCAAHVTRSDMIFALGGGVTGDLAGFAAATYQRGIRYVQLPTTLLAAVDSSVGGKTAVDLKGGKNQAGCFYQPSLVICDTETLNTLSEREFNSGCAEIIKYGMIRDEGLFKFAVQNHIKDRLEEIIARCVEIKRDIVREDEFDTGERMLLNFGHTFGHAAESCSDFSVSHGEGVAMGMAAITRSAAHDGICEKRVLDDLLDALQKYGLPVQIDYSLEDMIKYVLSDKKASGGSVKLVIPEKIGSCFIEDVSGKELIRRMINGGIK